MPSWCVSSRGRLGSGASVGTGCTPKAKRVIAIPVKFVLTHQKGSCKYWNVRVELSREGRPLGSVAFWRGALDFEDIPDADERDRLEGIVRPYEGKPFTYSWTGYDEGSDYQGEYQPGDPSWFRALLMHVLHPLGYRFGMPEDDPS
jgi:hypothetical protein